MADSLSLAEFQQLVSNTLNRELSLRNVWVRAEFSDLRVAGGHCYMELIEKDTAGTTRAKMRAMIWSSTLGGIRRKFYEATGRDIASGMKVMVRGSISHHAVYGLAFTISDIDPTYSLGDMERLRREILERLNREGVINMNKGLDVPPDLQRIAVISAQGAAGYGDFMNQIDNNPEKFSIYTMLFPAVMQGERTAPTVLAALELVENTIDLWDAVVIIRGGGATTDLNGFDNYDLARRVATFPLPVIVGIGHERDRTVLDEVACVRCKTPTAVAAYIIDRLRDVCDRTYELVEQIARYGAESLKGEHLRLANMRQSVPALVRTQMMREKMKLTRVAESLPRVVKDRVASARLGLEAYTPRILKAKERRIGESRVNIQSLTMKVENLARVVLDKNRTKLEHAGDMLRLLSPENTLRRGYSITRVGGKAVTDPAQISPGEEIETTLAQGKLFSVKN